MTYALENATKRQAAKVLETPVAALTKEAQEAPMAAKSICSIPGCGKNAFCRGWCMAHHARWFDHGDPLAGGSPRPAKGEIAAFIQSALESATNDCIPWPYSHNGSGYGQANIDGRKQYVHRYICGVENGPAPNDDDEASHNCGHGASGCINRRHLSWKTPLANQQDKFDHGTHNRGQRHGMSKLNVDDVRSIRELVARGVPRQDIGDEFGVTAGTVGNIANRKLWAWLE